jgi:ubiquinone/menaquinone biosynthesis C-methylase UbiE
MIHGWIGCLRRWFRQRRYQQIVNLLKLHSSEGLILDLGGGPASFFSALFDNRTRVVLFDCDCNLALRAKYQYPDIRVVIGDGERLPFADHSIEATVCNSVIEHVNYPGRLAQEIRRVSSTYFLQTPNGAFPVETHSFVAIPFYHWIPFEWGRKLLCRMFGARVEYINSVHYLSDQQLRDLFPEAVVIYEKSFGLKKSFYVYHLTPPGTLR